MDYLLLRSFDNYINASMILARLDEEGITCYLKDEYTVTIDPILSNAVGGIKLMVHPGDFEEACQLLAGFDRDYRNALSCPKCGSGEVEYISKPGVKTWTTAILSWFFSSYALASEQVYHCFACEHEFKDLPEEPVAKDSILNDDL